MINYQSHCLTVIRLLIALWILFFSLNLSASPQTTKASLLKDEKGRVILPDSAVYEGDYRNGLFNGEGTLVWRNGNRYVGEFLNGLMHGHGKMTWSNGDMYKGKFADGMLNGEGHYTFAFGDEYFGEHFNDYFHGQGRYITNRGDVYEGVFKKGSPNGQGQITYKDNGKYEGEIKDWQMHGLGTYTTLDGDIYSGHFVNDAQEGLGEIKLKSGEHYKGNISDWRGHGQGVLKQKNGETYEGTFNYGLYDGQGVLTYKDGDRYSGTFKNGMRHGQGQYTRKDPKGHKKTLSGWWEYDRHIDKEKPKASADQKTKKQPKIDIESIFYQQPDLLTQTLAKLKHATPDSTELYMLNFAAYGQQDVFMKEALFAQSLFDREFGTKGHSIYLINNPKLVDKTPLATVTNLKRALAHIAQLMDHEEDILFLFLTSHGSEDHELSVSLRGFPLNDLPASELSNIINNTGIKWKVIVVSSCYSGGFIDKLKDNHTMVITSAKADHVSFGCSDDAELTYFGRAFFQQALPKTTSMTQAFEMARILVRTWEEKENYDHSQPQIWSTPAIENKLAQWRHALKQDHTLKLSKRGEPE